MITATLVGLICIAVAIRDAGVRISDAIKEALLHE